MRFLPTRIHAVIDYLWAAFLIATPFVAGFAGDRPAFWTAILFGLGAIGYSLLTDYELGAARLVPVPAHLALDAVAGLALALCPFALGLDGRALWPFMAFGGFAVAASLVTRTVPSPART